MFALWHAQGDCVKSVVVRAVAMDQKDKRSCHKHRLTQVLEIFEPGQQQGFGPRLGYKGRSTETLGRRQRLLDMLQLPSA